MLKILEESDTKRRKKSCPKPKLNVADRLLLALEYLREYRTYFHIGSDYGVSESQAYQIHRWVESALIQDKRFHLLGRKKLLESNYDIEVVLWLMDRKVR